MASLLAQSSGEGAESEGDLGGDGAVAAGAEAVHAVRHRKLLKYCVNDTPSRFARRTIVRQVWQTERRWIRPHKVQSLALPRATMSPRE